MLVSLTDAGRRLREKGLTVNLVEASGLTADEFAKIQQAVVTLRNNLIKAAQATPAGETQAKAAPER